MYTFLFDRRSLALFLIGAGATALLIFVAGVQVGMKLELPAQPVAVAEFELLSALESGPVAGVGAMPSPARLRSRPMPRGPSRLPARGATSFRSAPSNSRRTLGVGGRPWPPRASRPTSFPSARPRGKPSSRFGLVATTALRMRSKEPRGTSSWRPGAKRASGSRISRTRACKYPSASQPIPRSSENFRRR